MTELEHMLTATLNALEQDLCQEQKAQAKILSELEQTLISHVQALHQIQKQFSSLNHQQQQLMQHLQQFTELSALLKTLSTLLNDMLDCKQN